MIDRELVTRKMVLISEDLQRLEELAARSREEYLASRTDELVAERCLERMIGRMIDVNYHVVTESGESPPRDYFDSFVALSRIGALPPDFATRIAACAGLRNRIVHAYDDLDPGRVYDALGAALTDVPEYLARIRALIGSQPTT